jgi:hypothetical protein
VTGVVGMQHKEALLQQKRGSTRDQEASWYRFAVV